MKENTIYFEVYNDNRGTLIPIEYNDSRIPFDVVRCFTITSIPVHENRAGHAHKNCHQLLILVEGGVTVCLNDGNLQHQIHLIKPGMALHIPPMTWIDLTNFLPGTVLNVLASEPFATTGRIEQFDQFHQYFADQENISEDKAND